MVRPFVIQWVTALIQLTGYAGNDSRHAFDPLFKVAACIDQPSRYGQNPFMNPMTGFEPTTYSHIAYKLGKV